MLRYQKFTLVGVILITVSVLFLFIGLDPMLKFGVKSVSISLLQELLKTNVIFFSHYI